MVSQVIDKLELVKQGKVRDVYRCNGDLLIVATDRISAFDLILPQSIPDKGKILTQISLFWFDFFRDTVRNHLISSETSEYPSKMQPFSSALAYRSMLVKQADVVPFECVARGYLEGSGWKDYLETGSVCGIKLPSGLKRGDKLPETIFTPATKADTGHDLNVDFQYMAEHIGMDNALRMRDLTLQLYTAASDYALKKGIIIADTKFEFGFFDGELILVDEVFTPDSSRFWPLDEYKPGYAQKSFDKQYVRDYLEGIKWDKKPPVPDLPEEIVKKTREKYIEAYTRLTERKPNFLS
jgi:phosphoribosylaminoimidazole-succinocarboxamide synthase